jgi:uncharacterized Zn-finger protein
MSNNQQRIQAPLAEAELEFFVDCSDAKHRQHPTSPLPTYPPSCSRQHPQHLCSITTSVLDIEGHGLMGVGIGREDPSSGQYAKYVTALCPLSLTDLFPLSYSKYDAEHDKDNGGSVSA